jgi:hypothetical protein
VAVSTGFYNGTRENVLAQHLTPVEGLFGKNEVAGFLRATPEFLRGKFGISNEADAYV